MSAVFRHPMTLFILAGTVLFYLDASWRHTTGVPVEIDQNLIAELRADLARRGETSEAALQAAIDAAIEEEILVREARRLGLAKGDPIVRRRLAQMMKFYLAEVQQQQDPSEEELRAHLAAHAKRYEQPARVSFEHHFFTGEAAKARRAAALKALAKEGAVQSDAFAHGRRLEGQSEVHLQQRFGVTFARDLMQHEAAPAWIPLASTFGLHLVRITARQKAGPPRLADVASQLRQDWLRGRRAESLRATLRQLRIRYGVGR